MNLEILQIDSQEHSWITIILPYIKLNKKVDVIKYQNLRQIKYNAVVSNIIFKHIWS